MTKREHAQKWVEHLLAAGTHGAAMTDNTWDDALIVRLHQGWQIPFVKDFVLDRMLALLAGDDTAALVHPDSEVLQQLQLAGLSFGDIQKFIQMAVAVYRLFRDLTGR